MFKNTSYCFVLAALVCASALSSNVYADNAKPNYALTDTIHLPGAIHWDLMAYDTKMHWLFITRSESLDVLDTTTQKIVGSIPADGAHGVALAEEVGKGFVTNGKSNTVTVFDLAGLKPILTVPTGTKPDALVYDAITQRVFIANANSSDMTVVDAKTNAVLGTIKLEGQPEYVVVDGKGKLYVNLEDKSEIVALNTKNLNVLAHYSLAPSCDGPTGLAIDITHNRLFSVCANKNMLVVNAKNGEIIDTLPIGNHSDAAIFDAVTGLVFSSNGDGTLTIVSKRANGHYHVVQSVQTKVTARTMALNPATHEIYLSAAETEGFDPPTEKHPEPRPHVKPDTFMILTVGSTH